MGCEHSCVVIKMGVQKVPKGTVMQTGLQALADEQHIAEHVLKLGSHTPISNDTTQDGLGTCFDEQLGLRISCHEGIQI